MAIELEEISPEVGVSNAAPQSTGVPDTVSFKTL